MKLIYSAIIGAVALLIFNASAQAADYTVKMVSNGDKGSYYFEPKKLTIKSGDTVTWVNMEEDTHNIMAASIPKNAEPFMSPDLTAKDQKWSYTFKQSGTYRYHCHPHHANGMIGTVIVDHPSKADEVKEAMSHAH